NHELLCGAVGQRVLVQVLETHRRIRDGAKYPSRERPVVSHSSGDDPAVVFCETSSFRPILSVIATGCIWRQIVAGGKNNRQCFGVGGLSPVENSAKGEPVVGLPLRGC